MLYKDGYLITENLEGQPIGWLPAGRSLFRDKRIPRENLNGLLVEDTGMSAVLNRLTSLGGFWAQDPPYYASVDRFETSAQLDISRTTTMDWHGWQHQRTIYFYHDGPIVVADHAEGPPGDQAALTWHVVGTEVEVQDQRILLRSGENPVEMSVLHLGPGEIHIERENEQSGEPLTKLLFKPTIAGQLDTVTIFLTGDWVGAEALLTQQAEGSALTISLNGRKIVVPLELEDNSR